MAQIMLARVRCIFLIAMLAASSVLPSWQYNVIFLPHGVVAHEQLHRGLVDWCTNTIGAFVTLGGHTHIYGNSDASSILRLTFHPPSSMSKQEVERHEARMAQQEALIENYRQEGRLYELERQVMRFVRMIQDLTRSDVDGVWARVRCFLVDAPLPVVQYYFEEFKSAIAYYAANNDGSVKIHLSKRDEYHLAVLAEWLIRKGFGQQAAATFCGQALEREVPGFVYLSRPDLYAPAAYRFFEHILKCVIFNFASYVPEKIMAHPFNQLLMHLEDARDKSSYPYLVAQINQFQGADEQHKILRQRYAQWLA
jgi:hypothetical protein